MKYRTAGIITVLLLYSYPNLSFAQNGIWIKNRSLYGASISVLQIMPSGKILASSPNLGIFLSDIDGKNFKRIFPVSDNNWETAGNIHATSDNTIYAFITNTLLKKSTNEGLTWMEVAGLPQGKVADLIANEAGILFLTSDSGIYKSLNKGETWKKIFSNGGEWSYNSPPLLRAFGSRIFAFTSYELFFSADYGDTWSQVKFNGNYASSMTMINQNEFFITVNLNYPYDRAVYRTLDGGTSWTRSDNGLPKNCDLTITTGPQNRLLVGANKGRIYESTDKGTSWHLLYKDNVLDAAKLISDGKNIYAFGNGIIKSANGGKDWTGLNESFGSVHPAELLELDKNTLLIKNSFGLFTFSKLTQEYSIIGNDIVGSDIRVVKRLSDGSIFLGLIGGEFVRSYDNGVTWSRTRSPNYNGVATLAQNKKGYLFLGSYGGDVFCSKNNGASWESMGYWGYVRKFLFDSNDILFCSIGLYLQKSIDGGNSIQPVKNFGFNGDLISVTNNNLFVFETSGVSRSSDGGNSWEYKSNSYFGLNNTQIIRSVCQAEPSHLFLATDVALFESVDDGKNWKKFNDEAGGSKISSIFKAESGSIYISSANGFFELPSAITSVGQIKIPSEFQLGQNYPNPFNPSTSIAFKMPFKSFVNLKVYDMTAREVKSLISNEMDAGNHSVVWDGNNDKGFPVSSGIYFYIIRTENFISIKKMVLMR